MGLLIDMAEQDTSAHLRFLKSSIKRSLLFTFVILLIDIINVTTSKIAFRSPDSIRALLEISPDPVLLIALLISAAIQFHLLRRILSSYREIKEIRQRAKGHGMIEDHKSITDINYEIIGAVNTALKTWPILAVLFIIYFIACLVTILESLSSSSMELVNPSAALNLVTLLVSAFFFFVQTTNWMAQRKKMKELERMEMAVFEELNI